MELTALDLITFVGFIAVVVGVSLYASRKEDSSEDYFLAGRRLTWGLIGFSLIASNISTEHFVGMAGQAFGRVGLAIASYEWIAAISLVIVAWWLLPKFLIDSRGDASSRLRRGKGKGNLCQTQQNADECNAYALNPSASAALIASGLATLRVQCVVNLHRVGALSRGARNALDVPSIVVAA